MSQEKVKLPDLEINDQLWVELEVPYGKIEEKWDQRYKEQLESGVESGRIPDTILNIYSVLLDLDQTQPPELLLEDILNHDEELGYNILCLKEFGDFKNIEFFKGFREFLYHNVDDTSLHSKYHPAFHTDDKVAITGLLQLYDPEGDRLKTIHSLDYCHRKKPKAVLDNGSTNDIDLESKADQIVEKIRSNEDRDYKRWHSFKYEGVEYIIIKREIGDDVERQATGNIEEEPATFVAIKYGDGELEVITDKSDVAAKARTGVNTSVESAQFETRDPQATTDDVDRTVDGLLSDDLKTQVEESEIDIDPDQFSVSGIKLSSSPLPKHPSLTMKTDKGILPTIRAFQEMGYDLLESIDDIDVVYTRFRGREYSIRPKQYKKSEGEIRWKFQYDATQPSKEEREEFEELIDEMFAIDIIFEKA